MNVPSKINSYNVVMILLVLAAVSFLISLLTHPNGFSGEWLSQSFQTLASQMVGVLVLFVLIERLLVRRYEKERLILQMGSPDNAAALAAVRELTAHRWMYDGSLQAAYLAHANLEGANLAGANLQGARLWMARLRDANMSFAQLQRADLSNADLRSVDFTGARLQGASLAGATLQNARFKESVLEEDTVLPDGSIWTPDADLARFTDPHHSDFWRADHALSARQGRRRK